MKNALTAMEKLKVQSAIMKVLSGKATIWKSPTLHHPVGAMIACVLGIPGMKKGPEREYESGRDGFDTNGWQYDWWQRFSYNGKTYLLSGSGYYGGHTFHEEEPA